MAELGFRPEAFIHPVTQLFTDVSEIRRLQLCSHNFGYFVFYCLQLSGHFEGKGLDLTERFVPAEGYELTERVLASPLLWQLKIPPPSYSG